MTTTTLLRSRFNKLSGEAHTDGWACGLVPFYLQPFQLALVEYLGPKTWLHLIAEDLSASALERDRFMFEQAFKNIDDVLWKEAGCTTELDYTEQTSWLLFLKYLDGLEQDKADEAALEGKKYAFILDKPYRWEEWAAPKGKDGKLDHNKAMTGDDLRDFVNLKLFPYLHGFKQTRHRAQHHRVQNRRDLRRDQEQNLQRLQPARDHRPHR